MAFSTVTALRRCVIERIGVVGCGLMGSGIAEVCARAERSVVICEADDAALFAGRDRLVASMARAVRAGKLSEEARDAAFARCSFSTDLGALEDRELVIEAIIERAPDKTALFRALDAIVSSSDAILASNTSSIPIITLAMATSRPEQVIGLHFFNPVPVMPLVELIASLRTSTSVRERARTFAEDVLGKSIIVGADRAGFIVNALLVPYLLAAIRMLESGYASAEDIDAGMVKGCAHPMGPLALADFIGLDTVKLIADTLYEELKEPQHVVPTLLARMVQAGLLGRKSGEGFYRYSG